MKYALIESSYNLSCCKACRALGVRREGYYAWRRRKASPRHQQRRRLAGEVQRIFLQSDRIYGARRIAKTLAASGQPVARKTVGRIMQEQSLRPKAYRRYTVTTDSRHCLPIAPNLLQQHFAVSQPNTVWVSDFTYVPTDEGWLYLCTVVDLYSRRVVGYAMDSQITRHLAIQAFNNAFWRRRPDDTLIVHTDRGSQYCSADFQALVWKHRALSSMSRKGNPYDNACAETFFKTIKTECINHHSFKTRKDATVIISHYIELFYNERRLHSSLGYRSPCQFELAA